MNESDNSQESAVSRQIGTIAFHSHAHTSGDNDQPIARAPDVGRLRIFILDPISHRIWVGFHANGGEPRYAGDCSNIMVT